MRYVLQRPLHNILLVSRHKKLHFNFCSYCFVADIGQDLDEITENLFPSVEDLLLNMSVSHAADYDVIDNNYKGQYNVKSAAQTTYTSPTASTNLKKDVPQAYKSRDWRMQLDGLSPKPQVEKTSPKDLASQQPSSSRTSELFLPAEKPEAAFSVYHKMGGASAAQNSMVDEYETLPWHLNRRNSKVVTRMKQRKNSGNS